MKKNRFLDLIIIEIGFLAISAWVGIILTPDSSDYINGSPFRAGLYAWFVELVNGFWGLELVNVIQNLFAGFSVWLLTGFFIEKAHFENVIRTVFVRILFYFLIAFTYVFVSISINVSYWIPSAILTEGLSYPLFMCFFYYFLQYMDNSEKKYMIISWALISLCVLVRSHMIVFVVIAMFFYLIRERISLKRIVICTIGVAISLLCYSLLVNFYNSEHGFTDTEFTPTDAMLVMDFSFVGKNSDVDFMNEDQAELYELVLKAKESTGYSYDSFKDLSNMKIQYEREQLYDPTWMAFLYDSGLDNYINELGEKYKLSQEEAIIRCKKIAYQLELKMVALHPIDFDRMYVGRIIKAFARTILPCPGFVNRDEGLMKLYILIGGIIYFIYGCVILLNSSDKVLLSAGLFVLVSMFLNIAAVSLIEKCEPRYFAYATGVFYLLIIYNLCAINKKFRKKQELS